MALISVVVPVYNAAPFLAKCVDTILAQLGEELELVLVDDGSKDNSLELCHKYAEQDPRVKVVSKPNGGVSSARNCGLDNATGEWITFVDSDDWLAEGTLAACLPYMEEYEIIRFSTLDIFGNGKTHRRPVRYAKDWNEAFRQVVGHRTMIGIAGTLYRRRLFEENNIRFDTNIVYGEDWLALAQAMSHSRSVKTLSELYGYIYNRANEASCSNTISQEKFIQSLSVVRKLREMLGDGYEAELKRSRCYRVGMLVKQFGCKKTYRSLMDNRDRIDLIDLNDILTAKLHFSLRCRLLRLWIGYLAWGK
jgi:glycosyltransferase involved in cell wall biosynthesis